MGLRAVATTLVLLASSAAWAEAPPAASVTAVLTETGRLLTRGRELAPALEWSPALFAATAACPDADTAQTTCAGLDLGPCLRSLVVLYDTLRRLPCPPSAVRAVAAELLADDVGAMIVRMQEAARAVAHGRCDPRAAPDEWPARVILGPWPERLVVEPVLPLRAGTRYALAIAGLSPAEMAYARAHLVPRPDGARLSVPSGSFVAPAVARQQALGVLNLAAATKLARQLERDATELPAWPAIAGVALTLPAPLSGAELAALRLRYVPADSAPAAQTVLAFDVLDVRAGLTALRTALKRLSCPEDAGAVVTNDPVLAGPFPHVGALLRFRVESVELGTGDGVPATLGAASDPRPVSRPVLAAVPRDVAPDAPVVLLVGGLKQSAAVMLAAHAEDLAAMGMMAVALELPHQGERADGGEILTLLDPASLARRLRQSAVDAVAAIATARRCGFRLPDGRHVRPSEVLYAGYSLGTMVGTLVRAVEPDLGASVFFAPGGDLADWTWILVAQALGSPFLSCIGGPEEGRGCLEDRRCAPPGVCGADPAMQALGAALRLPYTLASAGGEPLAFAAESRADTATHAPLLLLAGAGDYVLPPNLAGHLADAYGLAPAGRGRRASGTTVFIEVPEVGHELSTVPAVRERAYAFLARRGIDSPEAP
ncbi:MAG TPA: hypothetical protein VNO26_15175 [Candidatus Limnocylindria bacterium]|nr:hypothetical protein [Candidatus Limnocylindria bacterium]